VVCVGACIARRHDALHASIVCFVAQDGERGGEGEGQVEGEGEGEGEEEGEEEGEGEGEGEGPFTLSRPLCVEWLT
jgi:hypothetical protein